MSYIRSYVRSPRTRRMHLADDPLEITCCGRRITEYWRVVGEEQWEHGPDPRCLICAPTAAVDLLVNAYAAILLDQEVP